MNLNRSQIEEILPHRPPFLFLDEITELEPGRRAAALWHVRQEEGFFKGHFPGYPVVPGVLLVEAAAQAGAVALLSCEEHKGKIGFLTGIDGARFRRQVRPGDTLLLEVEIEAFRMGMGIGNAHVSVEGSTAFSGKIRFALSE